MSLAVHSDRRVCVGCLDKAEDLAVGLVDPVALVGDAVLRLCLQVRLVGAGDVERGGAVGQLLVHVTNL
jgi:hypothetical protein